MFVTSAAPDHRNFIFDEKKVLQLIRNTILSPLVFCKMNKIKSPKVLVLGAWGCGAFQPTAKYMASKITPYLSKEYQKCNYVEMIAKMFYQVLVKEKLSKYYEQILFTIPNKSMISVFRNQFNNKS